jgi:uncharacterized membrane protein
MPSLVRQRSTREWSIAMLDLLMIVFTVVFFTVALLYVRGCEKLR